MTPALEPRAPRIAVVDAVRGLACVAMILWHTADAWLLREIHGTAPFERVRVVGGFAAPMFLWLAGLSAALVTELGPSASRTAVALRRAGWVLAVGYALKLLAYTVDHGAIRDLRCWPTLLLAIPAMLAVLLAFREPAAASPRTRAIAGVVGAVVLVATYSHTAGLPRGPEVLARLDVLHGIGAALATLALLFWGLGRVLTSERARAGVLALLAVIVAATTPLWLGVSMEPLPERVADYIARTSAPPATSGARFALFPWLAYALCGASVGTLLRSAARTTQPFEVPLVRRTWLLVMAAALVLCVCVEAGAIGRWITVQHDGARPYMRLLAYGAATLGGAGLVSLLGRASPRLYEALTTMGRSSLLVYGAHLELSYGLLGLPLRGRLGWPAWLLAAAALTAAMVWLARAVEEREARARVEARARDATGAPAS